MGRRFVLRRARRALARIGRRLSGIERRVVSLAPANPEAGPIGRALISYVVDPFLLSDPARISYAHTQDWECREMSDAWRGLGFAVDVIHWTNSSFVPTRTYDVLIDPRSNLERLAPAVGARCVKIFHAETAHWRTSDDAQRRRLDELAARRGFRLSRTRFVGENRGIEVADCAVVLGNEWTLASYRPFGKPLFRVPLSNAFDYPSPEGRSFERLRGRFLWFGGVGFVHKGLDLALDAIAGVDGLSLEVAAPIDREPDFAAAYGRELFRTPNVRALGWIDVAAPEFLATAERNLALLFPSCSEGGGGSAITAMHAGLIPVVTRETSVDFEPTEGVLLADARVETIRAACLELSARSESELRALAVGAWRRARTVHTREAFARNYRSAAIEIVERFRPDLAERLSR